MGYLISAHITLGDPDLDGLETLPPTIGYRAYRHASVGVRPGSPASPTAYWRV